LPGRKSQKPEIILVIPENALKFVQGGIRDYSLVAANGENQNEISSKGRNELHKEHRMFCFYEICY
jgi:hypothetical protein